MEYRVLLVGGGSGGHVYPLIAVARALSTQAANKEMRLALRMLGDGIYVQRAAQEAQIPYSTLIAPKLRRYASTQTLLDIFKTPFALVQSLWHLFWFMPDVVFCKGGYTGVFPVLVARLYRIPVYLHESDSVPGLANRFLARFSSKVFVAFASAGEVFARSGVATALTGNPVRTELTGRNAEVARKMLGFAGPEPVVFVTGGSQGARQLNELVVDMLPQALAKGWRIIHQVGDANVKDVERRIATVVSGALSATMKTNYRSYAYLNQDEMATAYAAADVVVSRAGAEALSEISYLSKPCVLAPLAGSANDHQRYNAKALQEFGALVVDSVGATPSLLMRQIEALLNPAAHAQATERIHAFARPDAASSIATTLLAALS
jgi:UDP-N-acetylglucosamine--N-acetylmuramyl-(pentapeptide) pyrophosphoryl-undecaprenol N-acetylglucosamine transferase